MPSIIDQIKERTDLTALIAKTFTLTGRDGARTRSTAEHDSLIIWTDTHTWRWFSQGVGGDCLDWYQHIHRVGLADAIDALAQAANIERRPLTPAEQQQRTDAQRRRAILRLAADHYHHQLIHHPAAQPARDYCASRAWTPETIAAEMIGCTLPADLPINQSTNQPSTDNTALSPDAAPVEPVETQRPLATKLREQNLLDHPAARAVLSIPPDMLVYVHRERGVVVYLSARSITGKRHYNLPADLVGERQPYRNGVRGGDGPHILVEGQADAISLGQMGVAATALAGMDGDVAALHKATPITHVGLDNQEPARKVALEIAASLNPMLPIVEWQPIAGQPVKDANDALRAGIPASDLWVLLEDAKPALLHMAAATRRLTGDLRIEAQRLVLDAYLALDELVQADIKPKIADALGEGIAQLGRMIKARAKEQEEEAKSSPTESAQRDVYSAGGYIGGHLVEQFVEWDAAGEPFAYYYVRYPDGHIDRCASIVIGNTCYMPINPRDDENISKKTVLFPSALGDYDSESELLADIRTFLHKWFDMEPFWERITSYYVLFTWFYDCGFETIPYLRALGDYGTGKTRYIETAGFLCFRPMLLSGADSEPILFRMIDDYRGTMIVDEAQFSSSAANELIAMIINMGNRINGNVKRLEGDNGSYKRKVFMVFCPKIFAARYEFGDDAMGSRCLTRFMTKSDPRHDVPRDTDPSFRIDAQFIRNKLAHYRLKTWKPAVIDHSLTDFTITARLSQITLALRSIIKDAEALAEMDTYIKLYNASLLGERSMTDQAIVVHALARIFYGLDQAEAMIKTEPDFTLGNIVKVAQELMNELDSSRIFTSKNISPILRNQLGLSRGKRDNSRRSDGSRGGGTIAVEEPLLLQLMARYGIDLGETDQ